MALKICFFLLTFALQPIVLCDAKTTAEALTKGFIEKKVTGGNSLTTGIRIPITTLDFVRIANIGIGTPPQNFKLLASFSFPYFWVFGTKEVAGENQPWYNSSASSTAKITGDPIQFTWYDELFASGIVVQDKITAGDSSIPYIELCAASQIEKNWRREIKADGELGLALNANETGSETRKILTPIASLVNNSKVPLMIIFQKRTQYKLRQMSNWLDGSLTMGGKNTQDCCLSDFRQATWLHYAAGFPEGSPWHEDKINGDPRLTVNSLRLSDGFDVHITARDVLLIDGPFGFYLNNLEAERIAKYLKPFGIRAELCDHYPFSGEFTRTYRCYRIPCNRRGILPSLRFEFSDAKRYADERNEKSNQTSVFVDFNEYIVNYNSTMCVLLVFGNIDGQTKREEPILIGTGMFQDKCIAFDIRKERMTFVRSTHGECSSKENDGKHPAMFDERINFASTVENGQ